MDAIAGLGSPLTSAFGASPSASAPGAVGTFDALLGRAVDRAPQATTEAEATRTAEALVADIFIKPLLASVRNSSTAPPPFAPTQAEKQFGGMLDATVARDVVHAARLPIVDRLARDLLGASA